MAGRVKSLDAKAYYNTTDQTSTTHSGTWVEMTNIRDVSIPMTAEEADVSTRVSAWKQFLATQRDVEITFGMVWRNDPAADDIGLNLILDAFNDGSEVALAFMDAGILVSKSEGITGNFVVTAFERGEELAGALMVEITVRPSQYTKWHAVA